MKKIWNVFFDESLELREQLFRNIIFLGAMAGIFAMIESVLLDNFIQVILPFVLLFFVLCAATYLTMKYHKIDISAVVVYFVLAAVMFPVVFFKSGGIRGGATVWFVFSICYIFLMFNGIKLWLFLGFSILIDSTCYLVGYYKPELITPLHSEAIIYLDSAFSVFAVGITASLMIRTQINMFRKEREITRQQTKELEKAGDYKNAFFANVSHDIRTPLNSIIGLNDMITREDVSPKVLEYVNSSSVASQMLLSMVNDFLDISQIELKKMTLLDAEYETRKLIDDILEINKVLASEKGLEFLVNIDDSLPSVLLGDKKRFQQILMNLLSNAIKYTHTGEVTFSIMRDDMLNGMQKEKITEQPGESRDFVTLKIVVQDTGVGIRSEDLANIYDSFKRFGADERNSIQGTGLGLYITKQLVDLMQGTIAVDSIYKKGSTFTVTIPQQIVDATPISQNERKEPNTIKYHQMFEAPEARILVVDDDYISRAVTKSLLEKTQMEIEAVSNGMECLEMTKKKHYHVILMDHLLPDYNGDMILQEIRNQENGLCKDSPVILITANNLTEARRVFQENRFHGYLQKPYTGKDLEQEILNLLPEEIVEYSSEEAETTKLQKAGYQKHKGISITSDSVCEIPEEWMERYDIHLINLFIQTERGRFADTKEIYSNYMSEYLSTEESHAQAVSATVEEYEEFFAEELTNADEVIHISMASNMGVSYETAMKAAKGFDHVHIIDSSQISGGQGILVMYAAKLAMNGTSVQEIIKMVEEGKMFVESRFLMTSSAVFYQKGYIGRMAAKIMLGLKIHPSLIMKQSKLVIDGYYFGKEEHYRKQFIKTIFRNRKRVDDSIVVITHVGWKEKEIRELKKLILGQIPFAHVIIENASVSNACNAGLKTLGISFVKPQEIIKEL